MTKQQETLVDTVREAISGAIGQPSSVTSRCIRWNLQQELDVALQFDPPQSVAFLWVPWSEQLNTLPGGAEHYSASTSRPASITTSATPRLGLGNAVARIRLCSDTDYKALLCALWSILGVSVHSVDNTTQSQESAAPEFPRFQPSAHLSTAKSRGQLTELFLRGGWGPVGIAAILVGAWLLSDWTSASAPAHPAWIAGPALGLISIIALTLLVWPARWLVGCSAAGCVAVSAFMSLVDPALSSQRVDLLFLPVAWIVLQAWLVRQWWVIHDAGPTGEFTLRNLPRAKYLPTLIGMSLSTLVGIDYVSRAILEVGIVESIPIALQGAAPPVAERVAALLHRLPNIQFSLFGLLLCATSALAIVAGDTELSETVRRWAKIRAQDIQLIRSTLLEQVPEDAVDATVYKRLSHEISHLSVQLRVVVHGVWLAARAFPQLMAAGLLDVIKTTGINLMASFLLLVRVLTGSAAAFACGVLLAVAINELLFGALGTTSYWNWGAWATLTAFGAASVYLCLIAEWQQISVHLHGLDHDREAIAGANGQSSAVRPAPAEPGLVFYPLRAFVVSFVAFPVGIMLAIVTLQFLSVVSVVDEPSMAAIQTPGIRAGRWLVIGILVGSILLGFGYAIGARSLLGSSFLTLLRRLRASRGAIEGIATIRDRVMSLGASIPSGYERLRRIAHGQLPADARQSSSEHNKGTRIDAVPFELRSGESGNTRVMFDERALPADSSPSVQQGHVIGSGEHDETKRECP